MRRGVLALVGGLSLACSGAATPVAVAPPTGPFADMAHQFGTIDCSDSSQDPDRAWCPVTKAGRGPFKPSPTTLVRLGLTLAVLPGQDPKTAMEGSTTLSALYIGSSGAKIVDIKPTSDDERQALIAVVMSISATLKGVQPSGVLAKHELASYLRGDRSDLHALTVDADGASFDGMANRAIVEHLDGLPCGAAWVVLETSPDRSLVSVFPDVEITELPQ